MTTFNFDFSHFEHMIDRLADGLTVTLERENGSKLEIFRDVTDSLDDVYTIILQTPGDLPLQADQVFYPGDLFNFLQGTSFTRMAFAC